MENSNKSDAPLSLGSKPLYKSPEKIISPMQMYSTPIAIFTISILLTIFAWYLETNTLEPLIRIYWQELNVSSLFILGGGLTASLITTAGLAIFIRNTYFSKLSAEKIAKELEYREEKFVEVFNHISDAIFMFYIYGNQVPGKFIEVNNPACQLLGYEREELLKISLQDIVEEEDLINIPYITGHLLEVGPITFEAIFMTKSGDKIPIEISARVFTLDEERLVIASSRNITERKRIEERLRNHNKELENNRKELLRLLDSIENEKQKTTILKEKVENILYSIAEGVFVLDDSKRIILFNKAAENISGFTSQEVIGSRYCDILKFLDEQSGAPHCELIDNIYNNKTTNIPQANTQLIKKDSSKMPVLISSSPLKENDKIIGCVIVFRDITKEREVDRMKTEFISLASHQLKTPLSAIRWFTELLKDKTTGKLNSEQADYIENIYASTERLIALVDDLLNISRIESGRIIIDPEPTELKLLIDGIIKDVQNQVQEKQQNITVSISQDLPNISIDPKLIRQVYLNLLTNAIKYTPEKGRITITVDKDDENIISSISDTGLGIPQKDYHKVFEKFYRGDNVVKVVPDGNGLGLYLIKSIVDSSGGKIWFNSEEGIGTTFTFSLPLKGMVKKEGEVSLT